MARGRVEGLRLGGWTNHENDDGYSSPTQQKIKPTFEAYCDSDKCATYRNYSTSRYSLRRMVKKDVKKTVDQCPDCGYYLFWKKVYE